MASLSEFKKITDTFYCIGPAAVPLFLLDGKSPILFEAGVSSLYPYYLGKCEEILKQRSPEYLFITHMHFDHCGAAGLFKNRYPEITICGSESGAGIINRPSAQKLIARLNGDDNKNGNTFIPFQVDRILKDGEVFITDDGIEIEIIATPGHTRDMMSYYIRKYRILIPSESVGVVSRSGYIFSEFLVDYDHYMLSLSRLSLLEIDYLMCAHGVFLTGKECGGYFRSALHHAEIFRSKIESLISIYGDNTDRIIDIVKKDEYDPINGEKQPAEAYLLNLKAKINAIKRRESLIN